MTYRRDSDVFAPYVTFRRSVKPTSVESVLERVRALAKPKLVAWVVSNCKTNSKREDYVSELQKHIQVDIFGKCGTKNCPGDRINSGECKILLERDYMFYLAFENSKCKDYVTEKLAVSLDMDIVPIVMGGSNYSALAPPGSFIDTSYYLSPKDLTSSKDFPDGFSQIGCNLCKALHELHDSIHSCVSVQVFHMHCRLLCNHRLPRSGQA